MVKIKGLREKLPELERKLEELNKKFEKYFMGLERVPPLRERDELRREILKIVDAKGEKYEVLYRAKQLAYRFNTYSNMWDKMMKAKEEGRPMPGIRRVEPLRQEPQPEPGKIVVSRGDDLDSKCASLYEAVKKEASSKASLPPKEKFQALVKKKLSELLQRSEQVELRVDLSGEKPKIKIKRLK